MPVTDGEEAPLVLAAFRANLGRPEDGPTHGLNHAECDEISGRFFQFVAP